MKTFYKALLYLLLITAFNYVAAQNSDDARALVKEGVQLNDAGKYADAIEKYNQALKIEPGNLYADFELAYSLFASGKGSDGIPYLEKVIAANGSLTAGAYDLLGSIYDKNQETDKAIAAYNEGIKSNPGYQRLYYNLGIVYFRTKQYAEAEKCAVEAIKLDPKHASSQRMYALVTFHQNKRMPALMGFCSFILLEPQTQRTVEAYNNIQHILQGGVLKTDDGRAGITVPTDNDPDISTLNTTISLAVIAAGQKNLPPGDKFEAELTTVFGITGQLSEKKTEKSFFWKYFADYFYKLSQSGNMPAFARLVGSSTVESAQWIKDNPQKMADLDNWVKVTERSF